jgi:hypothetical protein
MAPRLSTMQPTRSSTRLRERKEAADKAAAAESQATSGTIYTTTKNARKGKANRKTAPSKVAKRTPVKKVARTATTNAKKAHAAHHSFFMSPEQLTTIMEEHNNDRNDQMWVGGKFYAAGPGEEVPAGSLEIDIKVPSGLTFLQFPGVLKLVEVEEMEEGEMEEGEMEEGEMEQGEMEEEQGEGESSDSELSDISDITF